MAENRLNILIEAKNKASGAIKQVGNDLDQLQNAAGGGAVSFSALTKAGAAMGAALAAIKIGEFAFQMGAASAQSARLSVAFGNLATQAGQNAGAMLAAMRKAADGTINDTELIASANRAMLLGVADSADEMTKLLEVASARGKAMGLSTAQAFSDLVTGIGRMSPLILDNLGIVTGGEKVFQDYAASIGRTAESLSDAEKKQALLNKVVAESQTMIEANAAGGRDMAASFERMNASISNAKDALGALFAPAAAVVAENIARAAEDAAISMRAWAGDQSTQDLQENLFALGRELTDLMGQMDGMRGSSRFNIQLVHISNAIEDVATKYNEAAQKLGVPLIDMEALQIGVLQFTAVSQAAAVNLMQMADETDSTVVAIQHMSRAAGDAAPNVEALRWKIKELAGNLRDIQGVAAAAASSLRSSFLGIADVIGGATALDGYRKANQQLEGQIAIYTALGLNAEEIEFRTQGFVEGVRDANSELEKTLTSTDGIKASISAFDSLKDKVAGVLSGALSSGINLDDILPRQDAIEEDARRLADVAVNGYASPWAAYLQDKFPQLFAGKSGDIKGIAAGLLRDFEDGLRPELLDRERAKDRVRRMLLGEANISQLAQDIAGELAAEFGGQFSQADILSRAQSALGAGGAISSGATSVNGGQIASNALGSIEAGFADDKAITKAKNIGANFMRTLFEGAFDTADTFPFWDKLLAIIIQQRVAAAGAN